MRNRHWKCSGSITEGLWMKESGSTSPLQYSSSQRGQLTLVEKGRVLALISRDLNKTNGGYFVLLWHKVRWLPCSKHGKTRRPCVIKKYQAAKGTQYPPMHILSCFFNLYDMRELALATARKCHQQQVDHAGSSLKSSGLYSSALAHGASSNDLRV